MIRTAWGVRGKGPPALLYSACDAAAASALCCGTVSVTDRKCFFFAVHVCVFSRLKTASHGIAGICQPKTPALVETPPLFKEGLPFICALFV